MAVHDPVVLRELLGADPRTAEVMAAALKHYLGHLMEEQLRVAEHQQAARPLLEFVESVASQRRRR